MVVTEPGPRGRQIFKERQSLKVNTKFRFLLILPSTQKVACKRSSVTGYVRKSCCPMTDLLFCQYKLTFNYPLSLALSQKKLIYRNSLLHSVVGSQQPHSGLTDLCFLWQKTLVLQDLGVPLC